MNEARLTPDDPKLTAYALGELEGEDLVAVEEALQRDPALRATVEEIRATTAQLEAALAAEPDMESAVGAAAASPMHPVAAEPVVDEYRRPKKGPLGRLFQFPQVYFVVGSFAAACFAVMFAFNNRPPVNAPVIVHASGPASADPNGVPLKVTTIEPDGKETTMMVSVNVVREPSALAAAAEGRAAADKQAAAQPRAEAQPVPFADEAKRAETSFAQTAPPPQPVGPAETEAAAPKAVANETVAPAVYGNAAKDRSLYEAVAPETYEALAPSATGGQIAGFAPTLSLERPASANETNALADNGSVVAPAPIATPPRLEPVQVVAPTLARNDQPAKAKAPSEDDVVQLSAFTVATTQDAGRTKLGVVGPRAAMRKTLPPRGARFARAFAGRGAAQDNDFIMVDETSAKTTFPPEVDLGSLGVVRAALLAGRLPAREDVKIEELVNSFAYPSYAPPSPRDDKPFAATLEVAEAPWAPTHRLVRIGLKGRDRPGSDELLTIAKEVKIEVSFNPEKVSSYRLIGFENVRLNPDDYEKYEGPDISAGHVITALYEIVPMGAEERRPVDRTVASSYLYQSNVVVSSRLETASTSKPLKDELLRVAVGYRKPTGLFTVSTHQDFDLTDSGKRFSDASADFKFAAAVAEFGMILRNSPHKGTGTLRDVVTWAGEGAASNADDPRGKRGEFIDLARRAQTLLR